MGLLSKGKPLSWEDTKKHADYVRKVGIQQLVAIYHRMKDRSNDPLKFGDEIEYTIVRLDHEKKVAQLALIGPEVLDRITSKEDNSLTSQDQSACKWSPEYASYQIEGIPGSPYGNDATSYNMVEFNMKVRRHQLFTALEGSDCTAISITGFPRLGCPGFTHPQYKPTPSNGVSNSLYFPDEAIWSSHPRFKVLTENSRLRRGENQAVNIPVYKDQNTPNPFVDQIPSTDEIRLKHTKVDHLYADCMGFGVGLSCLQVTIQAANIDEARLLYDQMAVICPILLAISAATPACKGYLCDTDCRWDFISDALDDRTKEERGLEPLTNDKFIIPKSRWSSISRYIHPTSSIYNDEQLPFDEEIMKTLQAQGFDEQLAHHYAYLFIRDPLQLFEETLHQDPDKENDHFENIHSTNWNTMRFKPPPPGSEMGWRVEFRPLEVQLTDFENAALVVFVVILTRTILSYGLDFRIPISKLDENMDRAVKRDAVNMELFHFRKTVIPEGDDTGNGPSSTSPEYTEMDINTIMNGNKDYPGLIPIMQKYVNSLQATDADTYHTIQQYLKLIQRKVAGELFTTAKWIRNFVMQHPDYKKDSIITDSITYDLMTTCNKISKEGGCAELTYALKSHIATNVKC